ncbi:acetolactate synthase catalytic subunit [soil metagenome]
MHAGDLLVQMLINYRVEYVFGLPGGQTAALYDAIYRRPRQISHILMRDERSAAYAADAYARVTGQIGVCDATVGPGATKLPSGLAEAKHSSIPILAIVSDINQATMHLAEYGAASQALDQLRMFEPLVKWQSRVPTAGNLPDLFRNAMRQATSGRPGPVVLNIPDDVFTSDCDDMDLDPGSQIRDGSFPSRRTGPDADSVALASFQLIEAERPVIIAGGGIHNAGASEELIRLAERLDIPVATTWSGKGAIPENHPLSVGLLGAMGTTSATEIVSAADVVFLIGYKSAQNSTFSWTLPREDQSVIHLDVDPAEIGKVFTTAVGLVGDARTGLQLLLGQVFRVERPEWVAQVEQARSGWQQQLDRERGSDQTPVTPQRVMGEIQHVWGDDDLLVCDASFASGWGGAFLQLPVAGRRALFPRGIAGLGWGLPAAIGARFGHPDGTVVCLAGDGGFAYSVAEISTLVKYGLKVVCVVLNNKALSWIKWNQRMTWGEHYQSSDFPDINFAAVARGFGCAGISVTSPDQLGDALDTAFSGNVPVVIDVKTEEWETPLLAYRAAVEQPVEATARTAYEPGSTGQPQRRETNRERAGGTIMPRRGGR